jgi:LmbE family N-acetylglucosaminyl deacetylase
MRRSEDVAAARVLGAIAYHFDILDCIYRRSSEGDWLYPDVLVPPHASEAALPDEIAALLRPGFKPDDIVVSPLAIGRHVDHVLVREAVERLGHPLLYYADIPYTLNHPEILEQATDGLSTTFYSISNEGLCAWQEGIIAYASQISMLFITKARMQTEIRSYWQKTNGIYLWR